MQFLNPGAFLILGLIPVLLIIHSLKPTSEKKVVTTLFIWNEVLREQKGGFYIKKIFKNISLLLQILIIILTAIAMSSPFSISNRMTQGKAILIIDTSASMKTKTGPGSRFSLAKKKALDLIQTMNESTRVTIIDAGTHPNIKTVNNGNIRDLAQVIDQLEARDIPGDMEKSVYLALSFIDPDRNDKIYLITDGCYDNYPNLISLHQDITPLLVEGGEKNIGVTRFEFRQVPARKNLFEIMLEIKNFNDSPVICPVSLYYDSKEIVKKDIGLAANEKRVMIYPFKGDFSGILRVELRADDDFDVDNHAYAVISENRKTWVLLVTQGNYFLEQLLSVYPDIYVNTISEITPSSWHTQVSENDIVILDGIAPGEISEGNFLLLNTVPEGLPLQVSGTVVYPKVIDQDMKHPLMKNVNLKTLNIKESLKIIPQEALTPVLFSDKTGLLYTYESESLKAVLLGFDIKNSDLPFKVGFPVLTSNIFKWLHPTKERFISAYTRSGTLHQEIIRTNTSEISVKKPSGKWEKFSGKKGTFKYNGTDETGIYRLVESDNRYLFAVNLASDAESDIVFKTDMKEGTDQHLKSKETKTNSNSRSYHWPLFLLLVSSLIFLEFFIWIKFK